MKIFKSYALFAIVPVFSLAMFAFLRVVPSSRLWDGYSVLYVPAGSDLSGVQSVLLENGVDGFSCIENQALPLDSGVDLPEAALSLSYGTVRSDYLLRRRAYFFDREGEWTLFYVPEKKSAGLPPVMEILSERGIDAGLDGKGGYPFLIPAVALFFAAALVFFSGKKLFTAAMMLLPVSFIFSVPLYTSSAAAILLMYAVFLAGRIMGRADAVGVLSRNVPFMAVLILSFAAGLFSGFRGAFLFTLLAASEMSLSVLVLWLEEKIERGRYSFVPVKIMGARMVNIVNRKARTALLVLSASSLVLLSAAFFSASEGFYRTEKQVLLPCASSVKKSLPDLDDYVDWKWEAVSSPYVSLNSGRGVPRKNGSFEFSRYSEVDGRIVETVETFSYDGDFVSDSMTGIDFFDFPSIEGILKRQERLRPGFSPSGVQGSGPLSIAVLIVSAGVPLGFYFFTTRRRSKAGAR